MVTAITRIVCVCVCVVSLGLCAVCLCAVLRSAPFTTGHGYCALCCRDLLTMLV